MRRTSAGRRKKKKKRKAIGRLKDTINSDINESCHRLSCPAIEPFREPSIADQPRCADARLYYSLTTVSINCNVLGDGCTAFCSLVLTLHAFSRRRLAKAHLRSPRAVRFAYRPGFSIQRGYETEKALLHTRPIIRSNTIFAPRRENVS